MFTKRAICYAVLMSCTVSNIAAARGNEEVLTCRLGTEDRHARIAVVLVGGKTDSFAYYSKWKPRTCSIYLQRNRDTSKWSDKGNVTTINLDSNKGSFLIEHNKGEYQFVFRHIDRERYCGMDGQINGTLKIKKGSEQCELAGVMEEGTKLGQAWAQQPDVKKVQQAERQPEAKAQREMTRAAAVETAPQASTVPVSVGD
jgi:hypothetical protein